MTTATLLRLDRKASLPPGFDALYMGSPEFRCTWHRDRERDPLEGLPLRLRWDAEPPAEAFELLCLLEPRFERSFRRQRADFRDQTDSSYDFSLALFAFDAGWTCQEVADLLIAGRREHGDISKPGKALRLDYQERTLRKALLAVARRSA